MHGVLLSGRNHCGGNGDIMTHQTPQLNLAGKVNHRHSSFGSEQLCLRTYTQMKFGVVVGESGQHSEMRHDKTGWEPSA